MKSVWLIGAGVMGEDYYKVLSAPELNTEVTVIGRSKASVQSFFTKTNKKAIAGGLLAFLGQKPKVCDYAIVAVSREELSETTCTLLKYGVKNILVEKPAGLSRLEIENINRLANNANVVIGFNRRFYASVLAAEKIINEDQGVESFHFEFTEWAHKLQDLVQVKGENVMSTWFLGNSVHVADLAFFLGGFPRELASFFAGEISWHPKASRYAGAGVTDRGALFSYDANWTSAGRWSIEWLTANYRIILRPLEELHIQKKGTIAIEKVEIDNLLDVKYKPGLYLETKAFLEGDFSRFENISSYLNHFSDYLKIAAY